MVTLLQQLHQQRLPVPANDCVFDEGDVSQQLVMVGTVSVAACFFILIHLTPYTTPLLNGVPTTTFFFLWSH